MLNCMKELSQKLVIPGS